MWAKTEKVVLGKDKRDEKKSKNDESVLHTCPDSVRRICDLSVCKRNLSLFYELERVFTDIQYGRNRQLCTYAHRSECTQGIYQYDRIWSGEHSSSERAWTCACTAAESEVQRPGGDKDTGLPSCYDRAADHGIYHVFLLQL